MKNKLVIIGILSLLAALCFGGWDNDKPADSDVWNNAAGYIRDNWDALEVALGVDLSLADVTFVDITATEITTDDILSKGPEVDIRAFGAGTSVSAATNATSIQAALDSLTDGGVVIVPKGDFSYDTTLTMLTNVGLVGQGPDASILTFTATDGTNAIECIGTGNDIATGTPKEYNYIRDIKIVGNSSSGHGVVFNIASRFQLVNVYSLSHGEDCFHIGQAVQTPGWGTPFGRALMLNCHTSGGARSVYCGGGDIMITGKCGFNEATGIGIVLEDMRISYINGVSGGSSSATASHGIQIKNSTLNTDPDLHFPLFSIHLNDIHWEQLQSGDDFVNVAMTSTQELTNLSITDCEYSLRAADGIVLTGVVKNVYIDRNFMRSRLSTDAAIGLNIGASCEDIYLTERNFWTTNLSVINSAAAGEFHFNEIRSRNTTTANTSGSSATNIMAVTINASYLETHGGLKITAAGTKTGGNGNKVIKLVFGATSITFHDAQNNTNDWRLEATIVNTATNAQKITWVAWDGATVEQGYDTASIDTTAAVTLAIEATCTNASDNISHEYSLVERF